MAVELPMSEAATFAPLFAAVPQDQSFIRAALRDGSTRVLVDDRANPSVAALWPARGYVIYFAGASTPPEPALGDVIRHVTGMIGAGAGVGTSPRFALPHPAWSDMLSRMFGFAFAPRGRRSYTLATDGAGKNLQAAVPDEYEICRMDADLARDAAGDADPEMAWYWPDVEAFAQRGLGFCAVDTTTGRVASAAWSVFEPLDLVEIGVGTSRAHRGRGLAPATAAALVRWCTERGLDPRWSTDFDNIPSRRVAAKIGFGNVVEHDWPLYTPFNAGRTAIDLPDEITRAYHGRYAADGKTTTIAHDGVGLRFYDHLGQTLTLAAESETRFFLREVPIQVEFTRGEDGTVDGFTREQGGKQWRMERLPAV